MRVEASPFKGGYIIYLAGERAAVSKVLKPNKAHTATDCAQALLSKSSRKAGKAAGKRWRAAQ